MEIALRRAWTTQTQWASKVHSPGGLVASGRCEKTCWEFVVLCCVGFCGFAFLVILGLTKSPYLGIFF